MFWKRRLVAAEREAIAAYLSRQALIRFAEYGPYDARGAAFWDVSTGIREHRIPTTLLEEVLQQEDKR